MDSHDNDQSAANGDVAENPSTNELRTDQSDFSTILALLFRRFDLICRCADDLTDHIVPFENTTPINLINVLCVFLFW